MIYSKSQFLRNNGHKILTSILKRFNEIIKVCESLFLKTLDIEITISKHECLLIKPQKKCLSFNYSM